MHLRPARIPDDTADDPMLAALVSGPDDVVGLLAYSMYSQTCEEWRVDFRQANGREPDEREVAAFVLGERSPRRQLAYRFLAGAKLAGDYFDLRGAAKYSFIQKVYEMRVKGKPRRWPSAGLARLRGALSVIAIAAAAGAAFQAIVYLTGA